MKVIWRNTLLVAGAFMAGGIGGALYDDGPAAVPTPRVPVEQWSLPVGQVAGFAKADAAWKQQSPWSVTAPPPVVVTPPPPPPFVPVGLMRTRRSYQAIFIRPGTGEEVHVGPGESLPGGGRFLSAYRMQVRWIDSDGRRQTRKLLFDPLVQATASGVIPSDPMPSRPMQSRGTMPPQLPSSLTMLPPGSPTVPPPRPPNAPPLPPGAV